MRRAGLSASAELLVWITGCR